LKWASERDQRTGTLPLIHRILTRPAFAQVDWSPKLPLLQACLPVFLVRSLIRKRLIVEIYSLLGACAQHVEDGLEEGVHEALSLMGAEIEKRAVEIESRIVQAVKGKRLLKGLDGHWQIQELDRLELTTEIETLASIERRLGSIRTDMLKAEPASGERPSVRPIVQAPRYRLPSAAEQERLERLAKQTAGIEASSDLGRDLNTRGCPACNRMADAASRFLSSWQCTRNRRRCTAGIRRLSGVLPASHLATGGDGLATRSFCGISEPHGAGWRQTCPGWQHPSIRRRQTQSWQLFKSQGTVRCAASFKRLRQSTSKILPDLCSCRKDIKHTCTHRVFACVISACCSQSSPRRRWLAF
jgi:hypothetical protein